MSPYPFSEWFSEQFRLTVFPLPGATTGVPEQWWEAILGEPPDQTVSNPKSGLTALTGAHGSGKLTLKVEPGRLDWLFDAPDPTGPPPVEFPSIGPASDVLGDFSELVERWLVRDDVPEVGRIAFGSVLTHAEPDRQSAYARLPEYLPIRVDRDSTDFLFQINVPVNSQTGIDGLRINRLSRWSVAGLVRYALNVGAPTTTPPTMLANAYALRVELDINTTPEIQRPVPKDRVVAVYRELVALGRGLVTEGLVRQ